MSLRDFRRLAGGCEQSDGTTDRTDLSDVADVSGLEVASSRRLGFRGGRFRGRRWWSARGMGLRYDTSVYQGIAIQMAQQAPLSTSFTVQNSPACALTLANGFIPCSATTPQTFGVDPNFRVGYVQTVESESAARSAGIAADGGDVPGDQGDARGAGVSAEYESCRVRRIRARAVRRDSSI